MYTYGGTTNDQFKFIRELLTNNYVQLDKEKCNNLRLNFYIPKRFEEKEKYLVRVKIGCVSSN